MGEKGQDIPPNISFGLNDPNDATLSTWVGTIAGIPGTRFDGRMVSVKFTCGDRYPQEAPQVNFITKVNLPFVANDGRIIINKFPLINNWNQKTTILDILKELAILMRKNGSLQQPPEDQTYF